MTALPVAQAARVLGLPVGTVRRFVREGCPAIRGRRGRGCATLVDPEHVRAWAGEPQRDRLPAFAADVPGIVADGTAAAFAAFSPQTRSGAEHRRLRDALRLAGDLIARELLARIHDKNDFRD